MQLIYAEEHIELYKGQVQQHSYYIEHISDIYLATACVVADKQKVLGYEYFNCKQEALTYLKRWDT